MAWIDYQSSLCSGCGHPRAETMDPANVDAYAAVPVQCFACAAKDAETRQASQKTSSNQLSRSAMDGLYIGVERREG